ncbi:hypothetical protein AA313_de0207254 [Arthrobotrys entomopaga]|nr:hypothetical protein AA313_de0207254 [Arthrobotrys entomopaga]
MGLVEIGGKEEEDWSKLGEWGGEFEPFQDAQLFPFFILFYFILFFYPFFSSNWRWPGSPPSSSLSLFLPNTMFKQTLELDRLINKVLPDITGSHNHTYVFPA